MYLRNGSVIRGKVVEQEPDGSMLVYQMSEVGRISRETVQPSRKEGSRRGWISVWTRATTLLQKEAGKHFNRNFYWKIGTGVFIPTGDGAPSVPVTSDFKVFFPLKSTSLTPSAIIRA